jgi:hypothetical protein
VRVGEFLHLRDFGHQSFIDMLASRGVEDEHVVAADLGGGERAPGDVGGALAQDDGERRDARLLAQDLELLHGGRAVDVQGRHQHALLVFGLQQARELGRSRGLARALQADHQDRSRRRAER